MKEKKTGEKRKNLIRLVHTGKVKLGWDEDTYRAFLWGVCGKETAADMSVRELCDAANGMRRAGFAEKALRVRPEERGRATLSQLEYIKGMWAVCARNKSGRALGAFVRRIAHVDAMRFLTVETARNVILALRDMMEKAGYDPDTSQKASEQKTGAAKPSLKMNTGRKV
ncbi:MAG: regulatory protein GemA [Spirochaetaceae bacterium]|jgi:phage gp16-like protein|nr:regulatory protein GemA [Spirochaetaceae bacterium]